MKLDRNISRCGFSRHNMKGNLSLWTPSAVYDRFLLLSAPSAAFRGIFVILHIISSRFIRHSWYFLELAPSTIGAVASCASKRLGIHVNRCLHQPQTGAQSEMSLPRTTGCLEHIKNHQSARASLLEDMDCFITSDIIPIPCSRGTHRVKPLSLQPCQQSPHIAYCTLS